MTGLLAKDNSAASLYPTRRAQKGVFFDRHIQEDEAGTMPIITAGPRRPSMERGWEIHGIEYLVALPSFCLLPPARLENWHAEYEYLFPGALSI
jgi:hypothetical protein